MSAIPEPEVIASIVQTAIKAKSETTPRTVQSKTGLIGPSDVGFCSNKAVLMTKGVPQSDEKPSWAADVGTAIHEWVQDALATAFPTWLCHPPRVTAEFPNGVQISGTPDIVVPDWNAVLDIKTMDGLATIKRNGTTQAHKYQRAIYAMGCVAEGLLAKDRPLTVGNVYLDRSGSEWMPYVEVEPFEPFIVSEINQWLDDVIYAVRHGEEGSRDVAAPVCERICEWFTVCRGGLPVHDNALIEGELALAVEQYIEGRDLEKRGKALREEARRALDGVSGTTDRWQVRWTSMNESDVPGYRREGYMKIDVRPLRRG